MLFPLKSCTTLRQLDSKLPSVELPIPPSLLKLYLQLQLSNPPERRGMTSSLKLALVMLTMESLEMGLSTITKAAMSRGMNQFVFVVYSNLFALPCLALFCFLFHKFVFPSPISSIPSVFTCLLLSHASLSRESAEENSLLHSPLPSSGESLFLASSGNFCCFLYLKCQITFS